VGLLCTVGLSAMSLLSFSQTISLSLLNDKKKEEGRRRMGKVGRKEEMGEKKKCKEEEETRKNLVFYVRCQLVIGEQKTPPLRNNRREVIP
jgi:hypothetical protein